MATPQYIKPSSVKDIIPPTTNTGVDINTQVGNIKKQYGNMNSEQLYGAMLDVKPPAQQDILQSVGTQYGYNDRIAGLRQQAGEIQRQMLADQSALFAATNPDGTPVDPRVKVSQFQENLTRGSQRLQQIQKIQDVYATEMQTLAGAIADQYKAKAQDTQTAIQFMQQLNQEKNADRSFGLQKDQFEWQKSQAGKPEWVQGTDGTWTDKNSSVKPGTALQDFTSSLKRNTNGTVNNVGQDANNPGNIMADTQGQRDIALKLGASGFYKSPNGRTYAVFPSMDSGMQAMMSDLKTKLSGGSAWVKPSTTLGEFASGWVSGPNAQMNQNAVNNYVKLTGFSPNTKISDIPLEVLAKAIVSNEGVDVSKNADIGVAGQYNPQKDSNLVEVLDNKYFDKTTGKTISGEEAKGLYGATLKGTSELEKTQYKNYLKSLLPSTLKDSATEVAALEKDIKIYQQAGLTMQEAGLASRGFNVKDPENLDTATQILNVFNNMKVQPAGFEAKVSNFLNAGDKKGLNNYITTALDREIQDVQGTEATTTPAMTLLNDQTKQLVGLIEKNKDKIGAFDGNIEQFVSKFKGTPEFQQIKTLLQGMQATQRKFFAGSAVTPSEMEALKDFVGGTQTMDANNLVTQLETVKEMAQKKYDAQRAIYLGEVSVGNPTGSVSQNQAGANQSVPGLPPGRFQSQTGTGVGRWQQSNQ